MFPVLLVSNPSTKVVRRPCFTRAGQSFIRPKYLSCLSILMWKVCGRCWGRRRSTIKVSPLTNPLIANKWQEMSGYESGSNSVRIVFCCFIPFHSSVIQTRLSMIGYISLNASGKVNSRCNKLYRYYSTSFDLSCEKKLFWRWILEDCPQVNKT